MREAMLSEWGGACGRARLEGETRECECGGEGSAPVSRPQLERWREALASFAGELRWRRVARPGSRFFLHIYIWAPPAPAPAPLTAGTSATRDAAIAIGMAANRRDALPIPRSTPSESESERRCVRGAWCVCLCNYPFN